MQHITVQIICDIIVDLLCKGISVTIFILPPLLCRGTEKKTYRIGSSAEHQCRLLVVPASKSKIKITVKRLFGLECLYFYIRTEDTEILNIERPFVDLYIVDIVRQDM